MKQYGWKVQEIQPSLDDFGMADCNIDSTTQLFTVPSFPPVSGNAGPQDRRSYCRPPHPTVDPEMVERRGDGGRRMVGNEDRHSARGSDFAATRECLSALRFRSLGGG